MARKNEQLERQLEKEKKIKQEINRIKKNYKEIEKEKAKVLEGLINEVSFIKISLEELRENLLKEGLTELFEQGEQRFNREKPEVKIYLNFMKTYHSSMKLLLDMIPNDEIKLTEADEFAKFQKEYNLKK